MTMGKRMVFFCSSFAGIDSKYDEVAKGAVEAACRRGYEIVYGGTYKGTMAVVHDTALACGARIRGVLPRSMADVLSEGLTETVWTDTMSQRKDAMREGADIAVALPGGVGTIDELSETFCLAKMDLFRGRLIVFNLDGFYDDWLRQIDKCVANGMLYPETVAKLERVTSVGEFVKLI